MVVPLQKHSRQLLTAVDDLHTRLGRPANLVQAANVVGLDEIEARWALEELLAKRLVRYAADVFGEWWLELRDMEPMMLTQAGRRVLPRDP